MLKLQNTLSGQLEEFRPLNGNQVRMYACGPTVYNYVHIGNFRTFVFVDLLRRYLIYLGYEMYHVMNITDIDDKIIKRSVESGKTLREYTSEYLQAFIEDLDHLNIQRPEKMPNATDHIPEMIDLIRRLQENGRSYTSDGSVYFNISSFPDYGKLSKINLEGNVAGARVDVDSYEKDNARDFALWKSAKPAETSWDTPYGNGRPGWHLECSAMSMKYLGESFDIHCGGVDLIFPHHENEIAQSEGATGKPFVHFWVHSEHLMVEGQRMGKSLNNYFTFRDLIAKNYAPMAIRYQLISVPYRKQLNFTFEGMQAAATSLERLLNFRRRVKKLQLQPGENPDVAETLRRAQQKFEAGMNDDLNTSVALAAIFDMMREVNAAIDHGTILAENQKNLLALIERFDTVLGVLGGDEEEMLDDDIARLIEERNQARKSKNFARSDEIRDMLAASGIILEDTKDGVRWRRK